MKLLIAGCGYVGTAVGRYYAARGAEVWGLRRDPDEHALKDAGIKPVRADLLNPDTLKNLPRVDHVLICQSPSREEDVYARTYLEATTHLMAAIETQSPRRILLISSTSVYGTHDGSWVTEETDPSEASHEIPDAWHNAQVLLAAESRVLKGKYPGLVLRLAGIYGPGRNRIGPLRTGKFRALDGDDYTNRIHLEDIVRAVALLFEKGNPGEIYLGCDDTPVTQREFYTWILDRLGIDKPLNEPRQPRRLHGSNKRCSNAKLKSLGMEFKYPSYREGYEEILKHE